MVPGAAVANGKGHLSHEVMVGLDDPEGLFQLK